MSEPSRGMAWIERVGDGLSASTYVVRVRFADGTLGRIVIPESLFHAAGNDVMGQFLLQGWLAEAKAVRR